ncbi:hypothetical protein [Francisella sp. LA112445]|uniref:hypothetical protein n=1 Tax=Francisella sp. LA112445 TaxID=1395624 RepID=UPI001788E567|nr:hypothetical protein [Francisella sp. LA112445]QIW09694.1 hypothetical protein FIP56_02975 [Francisella sp. LA112445]
MKEIYSNNISFKIIQQKIINNLDSYINNKFLNIFTNHHHNNRAIETKNKIKEALTVKDIKDIINAENLFLTTGSSNDNSSKSYSAIYNNKKPNYKTSGYYKVIHNCKEYLQQDQVNQISILQDINGETLELDEDYQDSKTLKLEAKQTMHLREHLCKSFTLSKDESPNIIDDDISNNAIYFIRGRPYIFAIYCDQDFNNWEMRVVLRSTKKEFDILDPLRVHSTLIHYGEFQKNNHLNITKNIRNKKINIIMAGEILIEGRNIKINNDSGHFKPELKYLMACKEFIEHKLDHYKKQNYKIIFIPYKAQCIF